MAAPIVIIGAGLSGLVTAYRLHQRGYDVRLLEAGDRAGGRVRTHRGVNGTPMELGATWIHPPHLRLRALAAELGLELFPQHMAGAAFYQGGRDQTAEVFELPADEPFFRVAGGTQQITEALVAGLPCGSVCCGARVEAMEWAGNDELRLHVGRQGGVETVTASRAVVTLPPRRWAERIGFSPALPGELVGIAGMTHTWMADAVKCALEYERPWWRERGLSGAFFSQQGPVVELMDQCAHGNGKFALCGFLNGGLLRGMEREEQVGLVEGQLRRVFGEEALGYLEMRIEEWECELGGNAGLVAHQFNGHPLFSGAYWDGRLYFAGSETAQAYGGYMEGAVIAAERVVASISFDG